MPHDSPTDPSSKNSELPDEMALKVKSLETLLVSKGLVDPAALDKIVDFYSNKVGPRNGAYLVARSWVEKEFSSKLLSNPTPILKELGFHGRQGEHVVVLKNTREVHNLVVCTLCSCYPWPLLGLPPSWYKSDEYRSRSVLEPRKVLKEFGLDIPKETKVKVWDSTAEIRYLVLPMRPEGTDGMSIDELSKLVTRDSMIGAGYALTPEKK